MLIGVLKKKTIKGIAGLLIKTNRLEMARTEEERMIGTWVLVNLEIREAWGDVVALRGNILPGVVLSLPDVALVLQGVILVLPNDTLAHQGGDPVHQGGDLVHRGGDLVLHGEIGQEAHTESLVHWEIKIRVIIRALPKIIQKKMVQLVWRENGQRFLRLLVIILCQGNKDFIFVCVKLLSHYQTVLIMQAVSSNFFSGVFSTIMTQLLPFCLLTTVVIMS